MTSKTFDLNERSICPVEKKCSFQFLYKSKYNHYNLPIYKCETCGLQKTYPRPKQVEDLYQEDYYKGKADYSYTDERKELKFHSYVWDSRLALIQKRNPSGNLLEVGSSFGGFLSRAKSLGYKVQGVEISKYSSEYANQNGISTVCGELLKTNLPPNFYDVIVLNEVIEHLPNPKESLNLLTSLLKKNGLLILQTANFEGWQAKTQKENYHYYLPGHFFYYSESILKEALSIRGISHFEIFYGSDISLVSKLLKSRGKFKSLLDYLNWFKTIYYHLKSKIKWKGFPLTSGFVLYAYKGGRDEDNEE